MAAQSKLARVIQFVRMFDASVFPTHNIEADGVCSCGNEHSDNSAGKHPRLSDWKESASTDEEQIKKWFKEFPRANWGMAVPAHMVIIDCDVRQNGDAVYNARRPKGESAPLTTVVETPTGGRHYYFKKPDALLDHDGDSIGIKGSKKGEKFDILLNGHNVVIPPSIREGKEYVFVGHIVPELPELPNWAFNDPDKRGRGRPKQFRFNADDPKALELLESALAELDPDDRDTWVKVCVGAGRTFGGKEGRGYGIIASWASRSAKYNVKETRDLFFKESQRKDGPQSTVEIIFKMAEQEGWTRPPPVPIRDRDHSVIHVEGQVDETLSQIGTALASSANIYQKSNHLVYIGVVGMEKADLYSDGARRPDNAPMTRLVTRTMLPSLLVERANFYQLNSKGEAIVRDPPMDLMAQFIDTDKFWIGKVPVLRSFIDHPVSTESGEIISTTGYHRSSGLYLLDTGCILGTLRNDMTQEECKDALGKIWYPFAEFPFREDIDRAAFWASLFTIGYRHMFDFVPVFSVMAPAAGTGKTKMISAMSSLWLGRDPTMRTLPLNDEAEFEKIMPGLLMSGDRVISFDNIQAGTTVSGQRLEMVLTSGSSVFRLMRENSATTIENRATFFMTGNQISFSADMARRIIPINLDAHEAHPHLRTGFRCNPPAHVLQHRGELLNAAISITASYFKAGSPQMTSDKMEMGSFEHWFRVMRNLLLWLGLPDLGHIAIRDDDTTSEYATHMDVVAALRTIFPEEGARFKLVDVVTKCEGDRNLRASIKECATRRMSTSSDLFQMTKSVMSDLRDKTFEVDGHNIAIRMKHFGKNRDRMWYFDERKVKDA